MEASNLLFFCTGSESWHSFAALNLRLAACRHTSKQTRNAYAAVRVSFRSLLVQRDQWDTYWGAKKIIFLIRDIDAPAMAAAPVESCRFAARRCPWARIGSLVDVRKSLHRMRPGSGHNRPILSPLQLT